MGQTRRKFVGYGAASLLAAPLVARYAHAAEFTYKYGNTLPPTHPMNMVATKVMERIRSETNGRLDIQVFPNNQLGSDTDMLSQVRSRRARVLHPVGPDPVDPGAGRRHQRRRLRLQGLRPGVAGDGRRRSAPPCAPRSRRRACCLDKMWDNGFRQITSSTKPIKSPADLAGFKIRVPVEPDVDVACSRRSAPRRPRINFSEVYSALQTKVVDGQENPLSLIDSAKLYEVQKYCSLTNHMWDGFWFLANARAWDRAAGGYAARSPQRNLNAAAQEQRDDARQAEQDGAQPTLKAKGMVFNAPTPRRSARR